MDPATTPRPDLSSTVSPASPAASPVTPPGQPEPPPTLVDDLRFESRRSITLGCGKSSITLHANGKIVLRGLYIVSDAEGINRIAGGQIELN